MNVKKLIVDYKSIKWYYVTNILKAGAYMNNFLKKTNEKLKDMLNNETSILDKTKEKLVDKGICIPITSDTLMHILQKQVNQNDKIYNLEIIFQNDFIRISGIAKKLLVKIPFTLDLKPLKSEKRLLYFEVKQIKPLNQEWIKSKVLNKPPLLTYIKGNMKLDLNGVEKIRAISIGNIQSFEIKDRKLWVKIGI